MSKSIIFVIVFVTQAAWADGSYFQCTAYDSDEKQWLATSQFERTAVNKAYDACKKQSRVPQTCNTSKAHCDAVINGFSTRPMWQCTALDLMAKHWVSDYYTQRDDAALGAKAFCQQRSGMPDSCYINLMTCKNMNEH